MTDFGLYFSWGNTDGHVGGEYDFSAAVYAETPGAAVQEDLSGANDAASVILGDGWRIPSVGDVQELVNNCQGAFATVEGTPGWLFQSNINGNTIFMPAAGGYRPAFYEGGTYWLRTISPDGKGNYIVFSDSAFVPSGSVLSRSDGFTIRPVKSSGG